MPHVFMFGCLPRPPPAIFSWTQAAVRMWIVNGWLAARSIVTCRIPESHARAPR
ncbi:hypothetical protein Micbo1qcDRAFT_168957, partial [Microdochium bolleyi]